MDPFNQSTTSSKQKRGTNNSFARALAEMEKTRADKNQSQVPEPEPTANHNLNQAKQNEAELTPDQASDLAEQQAEDLKKQQLREKLHRKVNPVEQQDLFDARERRVKKELEEVRKELKLLAKDFKKFHKEIDVTLEQNIAAPGQEGVYYSNFFAKLKELILLLRQKIKSASTWAKQMQARKRKQQQKRGLNFQANEAKATHDMLHQERFNAYSGG